MLERQSCRFPARLSWLQVDKNWLPTNETRPQVNKKRTPCDDRPLEILGAAKG